MFRSWKSVLLSLCMLLFRSHSHNIKMQPFGKSRIITTLPGMTMNTRSVFGVTEKEMFGRKFFFKRDDKFSFPKLSQVTGNKVRKLHSLYYQDSLPPFVISYGGVQSNAMRALAAVCRFKGSQFLYLSRPVPQQLAMNPIGNYLDALNDHMKVYFFILNILLIMIHCFPPILLLILCRVSILYVDDCTIQ